MHLLKSILSSTCSVYPMFPMPLSVTQPQSITATPPSILYYPQGYFHQILLIFYQILVAKEFNFTLLLWRIPTCLWHIWIMFCKHRMFTFVTKFQIQILSDDSSMQIIYVHDIHMAKQRTTSQVLAKRFCKLLMAYIDFALLFSQSDLGLSDLILDFTLHNNCLGQILS